jgi:trehalose 6-phosphate synthase/phosphatase
MATSLKKLERTGKSVMAILVEYVRRCNGTFIEEKTGSIAWHYRNADSDFAQLRLHELRDDLVEIIRHKTNFEILEGNKVLEVKSGKYDKGQAANTLMKNKHFDFILAAGDDKTDESLFKALYGSAHTIRIGLSPSLARYNAPDFSFLLKLLKVLVK